MAEVKVKLFANLREAAGSSELQLSGEKVIDILLSLTEKYPGLKDLIFEKSEGKNEAFGNEGGICHPIFE
jgi:molybdopterin synthase sulfur carrier subunit